MSQTETLRVSRDVQKVFFYHSGKTLNMQNLLISPHNDGTCGAVVSTGSDWVEGSNPALGVCPCAVSMCQ